MARKTDGRRKQLTHAQFYKACETMKANRDRFIQERPSNQEAARVMSELCGFPIRPNKIRELKDTSGVPWTVVRNTDNIGFPKLRPRVAVLEACVRQLYRKLGELIPAGLLQDENPQTAGHCGSASSEFMGAQHPKGLDGDAC